MRQLSNYSRVVGYDDASVRLFGAMLSAGGQLSDARRLLIDLTIRRLKGQGLWDKLDCLYMFAALSQASALINWKTPGTSDATVVNSPTFTADRGFTGNGTSSYVETNFNASTAGGNFAQNDASFGVWCLSTAGASASIAGWFDGTDGVTLNPRGTSGSNPDKAHFRINQASTTIDEVDANGFVTSAAYFYAVNRSGASATEHYGNGVAFTEEVSADQASTALNNATFRFGSITAASFSDRQFGVGVIGGSLSAAQHAALYGILLPYMQSVGAV